MNVERVSARNFRSYEALDVELPEGVTAVVGPNGAGKSSLVTAVEVALFGERSLSRYVSRVTEGLDMEVAVEFTHGEGRYRVRRGYSSKGAGKSYLLVEQADGGEWESRTQETAAVTQEWLESLLGVSRATFRASAFLAQGDGAAFTEAQPRERKQILADVLGLDLWARLESATKAHRVEREAGIALIAARIADLEERAGKRPGLTVLIADARVIVDEQATRVEAREAERDALSLRMAGLDMARERLANAEKLAGERRLQLGLVEQQIEDADAAVQALNAEIESHAAGARRYEQRERLEAERDVLAVLVEQRQLSEMLTHERAGCARGLIEAQEHLDALKRRAVELCEPSQQVCESCGQPLADDAALGRVLDENVRLREAEAASVAEFTDRLTEIEDAMPSEPEGGWPDADRLMMAEAAYLNAIKGNADAALATAKAARVVELQRESERLNLLVPKHRDAVVAAQKAAEKAQEAIQDAPPEGALGEADAAVTAARGDLTRAQTALAVREAEAQQADDAGDRLDGERRAVQGEQVELETLRRLEKAFGRDGVPAMVVESIAVPQIETEANRILAELGAAMTVELRTQRATQAGEIREALDIIVADATGEAPYEDFSGGEKTRLNLALRIALARLLASRRGAQVRLLVVDEPEFLDDAGMDRLAGVLRGLNEFDKCLVVSHHDILKDAFDQVLSVRKVDGRSQIEGAAATAVKA